MAPGRKSKSVGPAPPATTLVLDNGADTIKSGFVTAEAIDEPRVIPNCIARDRHYKTYVGGELEKCKDFGEIALRRPVEKGFIVSWEAQKEIWDRSFFDDKAPQKCDPSQTRLVLAEQPNSLPALQTHCDQIVFEEYGFASYYRGVGPTFNAYQDIQGIFHTPREADAVPDVPAEVLLVIDSGYSSTTVTPILQGRPLHQAIRRLDVGGKLMTNYLTRLLSVRHFDMRNETYIVNEMKEAACYVSLDFKSDLEKTWKGTRGERRQDYMIGAGIAKDYILPDSHTRFHGVVKEHEPGAAARARKGVVSTEDILTLRNERFVVPELLFHPTDVGMQQPGLADLVMQSLSVLPVGLWPGLLANIVVVGGNANFENFIQRLQLELLERVPDDEEAEMDISGDEGDSPVEPSSKRARTSVNQSAADDSAPKWSNPDPYTALPPETANQKKKDVVQLIRKARVQAKETRSSLPSETADFIALDFDDSDQSNNSDDDIVIVSESKRTEEVTVSGSASSLPAVPVPTGPAREAKVPSLLPDFTSSALGSRKRTADDQIKLPHSKLKRPAKFPAGGQIVEEWRAVPHLTSTPWLRGDHSQSKDPLVWLHKEIVDFYDYIKPRHFEEAIREELVQEMKKVASMLGRDAVLHPFGSFPSGLYLPTGDMDLVVLSESFIRGGQAKYDKRNSLYKFRNVLHQTRVAWENDVELIAHAKVPLVKFVDKRTGLKVDISFENTTGLTAIRTFLAWKDQYPGMPALVTLIKHFLLMRGLNEPVNGGIGGFSVICLVVSMFQMMPEVQSGALDTQHHLGDLLLHFFDLYGNKFDLENVAIRLNPPGYIPKDRVHSLVYRNYNRLSIIDPNNPENDIAGGSSNAPKVFSLFSRTYQDLRLRMKSLAEDPQRSADSSILGTILGGNYTTFQEQRDYLEDEVDVDGHIDDATALGLMFFNGCLGILAVKDRQQGSGRLAL
ncbi:hypothetical protein QBC35DRAFT_515759 [Podospora australis]|uniref:polynucleotide adenylyltransferase n=1 Tax=Podospora australis TaxID=1536484 RepID=A0AAN7AIB4_9PEZI|nr:hypothetical protein QBC35DRAFT_515759 [Podospora australis]